MAQYGLGKPRAQLRCDDEAQPVCRQAGGLSVKEKKPFHFLGLFLFFSLAATQRKEPKERSPLQKIR
jgi:hypothetical protein